MTAIPDRSTSGLNNGLNQKVTENLFKKRVFGISDNNHFC